jgi:protein tyrosine/serine phosphatase
MIPYRIVSIAILIALSLVNPAKAQTENVQKQSTIKIDNFGRMDDHYYRGAQPQNRDYKDLAALGIKTVISLTRHDTDPNEKTMVENAHMKYYQIPMDSHVPPTPTEVAEFLQIVNASANQPVYVHCVAGKHRTGVMTAIYRLSHGWTADEAYKEMKQYKFGIALFHSQLKSFVYDYYRNLAPIHTATKPIAAGETAH